MKFFHFVHSRRRLCFVILRGMMQQKKHEKRKRSQQALRIKQEVRKKTAGYIVGAFGLVAGLAWNDAVRALIDLYFPAAQGSVWAKFGYAAVVTVLVVIAGLYVARLLVRKEEEVEREKKR